MTDAETRDHARRVCLDSAIHSFCSALCWIDKGEFLVARRQLLNAEVWCLDAQDWLKLRTDAELRDAAEASS